MDVTACHDDIDADPLTCGRRLCRGQVMAVNALERVAEQLRRAGAKLPVENNGTIESAVNTGLSIALCVVLTEIEARKEA